MKLYFFERITQETFVGPVVIAAPGEGEAWAALAGREQREVQRLPDDGWSIAQVLEQLPSATAVVYPSYYSRAIT